MTKSSLFIRLTLLALAITAMIAALALTGRGMAVAGQAASAGVVVQPSDASSSGAPGATITYTLRVTNTGATADVFTMTVAGNLWPTNLLGSRTVLLPLNAGQNVQIEVAIPITASGRDVAVFTVVSNADPAVSAAATLTTTAIITPGVTITPTSGLTTTEAGGTANFDVVLKTQPASNVTIALSSSDTTEGTVGLGPIFTPANWNVPQTVTVRGVDDAVKDGDIPYTIDWVTQSGDPVYNFFGSVSLVNLDDEVVVTTAIDPTISNTVTAPNGIVFNFPAGVFSTTATVTYTQSSTPAHPAPNFKFLGKAFSFDVRGPDGELLQPQPGGFFTMTIPYSDSDWINAGLPSEDLINLAYFDETPPPGAWKNILPCDGCLLDKPHKQIIVRLDHLTDFGMLGPGVFIFLPTIRK